MSDSDVRQARRVLARLQLDAGQRTIGELIGDRAVAVETIEQLLVASEKQKGPSQPPARRDFASDSPSSSGALVSIKALQVRLSISRSTIYKWIAHGRFPTPLKLGPGTARWREDDIAVWIASQERA